MKNVDLVPALLVVLPGDLTRALCFVSLIGCENVIQLAPQIIREKQLHWPYTLAMLPGTTESEHQTVDTVPALLII